MHSNSMESNNNVPAFLAKLWKLVEDESSNDLIEWSPNGTTFFIRDQARLSRELLPHYFKHNNVASFIRQLNMYGFRKVMHVEKGGLRLEKDEIEFHHPYFIRDSDYLLRLIKRKIPVVKPIAVEESKIQPDLVSKVLLDVKNLHGKQESMDSKLGEMKRENEALWREVANLRQKHMKQQTIVNQLVHFLIRLVNTNRGIIPKRKLALMLDDSRNSDANGTRLKRNFPFDATNGNLPPSGASIYSGSPPASCPSIHDITDSAEVETINAEDVSVLVNSPAGVDAVGTQAFPEAPFPSSTDSLDDAVRAIYSPSSCTIHPVDEDESNEHQTGDFQSESESKNLMSDDGGSTPGVLHLDALIREINERATDDGAGSSSNLPESASASTSNVVAVGDTSFNKFDLFDHVENVNLELDTLQQMLSNSGCSIDVSTLLGVCPSPVYQIFSNEDMMPNLSDMGDYGKASSGKSSSGKSGTELMQYNPGVSDMLDAPLFDTDLAADDIKLFESEDEIGDPDETSVHSTLETPDTSGLSLEAVLADLEAATPAATSLASSIQSLHSPPASSSGGGGTGRPFKKVKREVNSR